MKTLIILVTFNGYKMTKDCLDVLVKLPHDQWKIAVADNASSDGTPQKIAEDFPQVTVYPLAQNKGFGFANNEAFRQSLQNEEFDYVCFLNNDTIPSVNALETLRTEAKNSKAIFAPLVKNPDGSVQRTDYRFLSHGEFFLNAFRTVRGADKHLHGTAKAVDNSHFLLNDWINAVCWFMPAQTFKEVGMFDEHIFMYYEDQDFAYRASQLGYRFLLNSHAQIVHLGGGSAKNVLSRSLQHDSSQLYFYRKHFGFFGALLSRSFRFVRSLLRIGMLLPFCILKKSARDNAKIHAALLLFSLGFKGFKK
ncbi:MAG: glycosyltransferase family 2 protein [Fibrobacter sp.]|nr:glycosyltransferase family 2 protein [Fibrobacter sp.]